jgi:hypothetical protein
MRWNTLTTMLLGAAVLAQSTPLENDNILEKRKDCSGNTACVSYYRDGGCTGGLKLGEYQPTCEGNCFRYSSFGSIKVEGNTLWGVDCHAYSDNNCQHQIADSGNQHGARCMENLNGAQSMKCYYRC